RVWEGGTGMRLVGSVFGGLGGGSGAAALAPGDRAVVIARAAPLRVGEDTAVVPCGKVFTVRAVRRTLAGSEVEVEGDPPGVVPGEDVMRLDRALHHFAAALRRDPRDVEVLRAQSRVWATMGEHERAQADQAEADRISREDAEAERDQGMARLTAEIESDPTSPLHYLARGDEWLECGELDR